MQRVALIGIKETVNSLSLTINNDNVEVIKVLIDSWEEMNKKDKIASILSDIQNRKC